jgi:hypothetical protein
MRAEARNGTGLGTRSRRHIEPITRTGGGKVKPVNKEQSRVSIFYIEAKMHREGRFIKRYLKRLWIKAGRKTRKNIIKGDL